MLTIDIRVNKGISMNIQPNYHQKIVTKKGMKNKIKITLSIAVANRINFVAYVMELPWLD